MLSNFRVRRIVLFIFWSFSFSHSFSQLLLSEDFIKEKSKPFYVSLVPERSDLNRLDMKSVLGFQVLDYLPDSSRIGFFKEKGNEPCEILLKHSTPAQIGDALTKAIAVPNGTRSYVIVLRKLWLSDVISGLQTIAESQSAGLCRTRFKAEVYLKEKDFFVPLFSFDTLILSRVPTKAIAPFQTPELLTYLLKKLQNTDINALVSARRKIGFAALDAFSRSSYTYAADSVSIPRKGVYATLAELKNNTPSGSEYELRQDGDAPINIYLRDAQGTPYLTRKVLGLCDGENLFIMMGGNLYPGIRSGHSIYVYGTLASFVKKNSGVIVPRFPLFISPKRIPGTNKPVSRTSFFALDMDTGELH